HHHGHAVAAALDHLAALGITAGAGNSATVLGHVALAHTHGQVAAEDNHAVHHHATGAHAAREHGAEVLHHAGRHLVVTATSDLHAAGALLHLHGAARHHHHVGHHRGSAHRRTSHRRHAHASHPRPFHHHRTRHDKTPFLTSQPGRSSH